MRAGAMEMEYVVKLILMLVVVAAVIALVWTFYGNTQNWWCKMIGTCPEGPPEVKTEVIKQPLFTASDVAKYVDSCWLMTGEDYSGDAVCYVLQGAFEAGPDSIADLLRSFPADKFTVQTDFRGDSAVVQFKDTGNRITVS
jgi:hypothetical protein